LTQVILELTLKKAPAAVIVLVVAVTADVNVKSHSHVKAIQKYAAYSY